MTERKANSVEAEISVKLDNLVDKIDENKHEIFRKIEEIREDKREQINSIFSWMEEQGRHCSKIHSQLDVNLTALQTDYKNTKDMFMDRRDFGGKLTIVLVSSCVSIFLFICQWFAKMITERG